MIPSFRISPANRDALRSHDREELGMLKGNFCHGDSWDVRRPVTNRASFAAGDMLLLSSRPEAGGRSGEILLRAWRVMVCGQELSIWF